MELYTGKMKCHKSNMKQHSSYKPRGIHMTGLNSYLKKFMQTKFCNQENRYSIKYNNNNNNNNNNSVGVI